MSQKPYPLVQVISVKHVTINTSIAVVNEKELAVYPQPQPKAASGCIK